VAALEVVMHGTGQLVLLSGEPGVGKTRLAQEASLKARHWNFHVATGRCYEAERSVPYYPFLEALSAAYASAPAPIRTGLPHRWPDLPRLILDESLPAPPAASASQDDQQRLFRAVTGFIEAFAETMPIAPVS